jgi:hypothetical protein
MEDSTQWDAEIVSARIVQIRDGIRQIGRMRKSYALRSLRVPTTLGEAHDWLLEAAVAVFDASEHSMMPTVHMFKHDLASPVILMDEQLPFETDPNGPYIVLTFEFGWGSDDLFSATIAVPVRVSKTGFTTGCLGEHSFGAFVVKTLWLTVKSGQLQPLDEFDFSFGNNGAFHLDVQSNRLEHSVTIADDVHGDLRVLHEAFGLAHIYGWSDVAFPPVQRVKDALVQHAEDMDRPAPGAEAAQLDAV